MRSFVTSHQSVRPSGSAGQGGAAVAAMVAGEDVQVRQRREQAAIGAGVEAVGVQQESGEGLFERPESRAARRPPEGSPMSIIRRSKPDSLTL